MEDKIVEHLRFINKIKKEAIKEIVDSIAVNDNIITGAAVAASSHTGAFGTKLSIKFMLNGREFRIDSQIDEYDIPRDVMMKEMIRVISEELSKELINKIN